MFTPLVITLILLQPAFGQRKVKKFSGLSTDLQENKADIIYYHNECRKNVDPPAQNMLEMGWDDKIAEIATEWANMCYGNHSSLTFRTRNGVHFGENIVCSNRPIPWKGVINVWKDECKDFTFGMKSNTTTGHYTQVVWGPTNKCGCSVAHCPDPTCEYFYVCMYREVGNLVENPYEPYIKGKTCGKCKRNCKNKLCQKACSMRNTLTFKSCEEVRAKGACITYNDNCQASCNCPKGEIYQ